MADKYDNLFRLDGQYYTASPEFGGTYRQLSPGSALRSKISAGLVNITDLTPDQFKPEPSGKSQINEYYDQQKLAEYKRLGEQLNAGTITPEVAEQKAAKARGEYADTVDNYFVDREAREAEEERAEDAAREAELARIARRNPARADRIMDDLGYSNSPNPGNPNYNPDLVVPAGGVDNNYQLRPGETPDAYNQRVAQYNASKGTTGRTQASSPSTSGSSGIDTNYQLGQGESIPDYNARIEKYNASKAPKQDANQTLQGYGYQLSPSAQQSFQIAPAKSFKEVYDGIIKTLGLPEVKRNIDSVLKKINAMDQELADKTADINENPWLTEGVRVSQIRKLQERYDLKRAPHASNLSTLVDVYNNGREEARYVSTQTLAQYNQERQFQMEEVEMWMDEQERIAEYQFKLMQEANKKPSISEQFGTGVIGEYNFAVSQGYKGSFIDYQNEDANRKKSIARAGSSGSDGTQKMTESERLQYNISQYANAFAPGVRVSGVPTMDSNGFITPVAWKEAIREAPSKGVSRKEFIQNFGGMIYFDPKDEKPPKSYGLTDAEVKLITG